MGSEKVVEATEHVDFNHPMAAGLTLLDPEKAEVLGTRSKIGIVGFATTHRFEAPFADPEWEIWGMNQLYRHIPRADRWFEIHENWDEHVVEGTDHAKWLREAAIPVYMVKTHEAFPWSVRYPIEELNILYSDYWTSSIAFMMGLAIWELEKLPGPPESKEIGLWGIDLIVEDEYFYQKACAEYFIGIACGKGFKVTIPTSSALCKAGYRYGYEKEPFTGLITISELRARHKELSAKKEALIQNAYGMDGAIQQLESLIQIYTLRARLRGMSIEAPREK